MGFPSSRLPGSAVRESLPRKHWRTANQPKPAPADSPRLWSRGKFSGTDRSGVEFSRRRLVFAESSPTKRAKKVEGGQARRGQPSPFAREYLKDQPRKRMSAEKEWLSSQFKRIFPRNRTVAHASQSGKDKIPAYC